MSSDSHHDIKKEVGKYYKVFGALLVLTVITVALNNLHAGIVLAVTLALIVATFKAGLVASFFMHLIDERKIIYVILGFTAFFFAGMVILILSNNYDVPHGTVYFDKEKEHMLTLHPDKHSKGHQKEVVEKVEELTEEVHH